MGLWLYYLHFMYIDKYKYHQNILQLYTIDVSISCNNHFYTATYKIEKSTIHNL